MESKPVGTAVNKIAIVTGGSRGLGRNTAENLARRGVDIIFTYRANKAEADSLIQQIQAMGRKAAAFKLEAGDVGAFDGFVAEVRKTLQSWGRERFDFLVNNAGNSLHAGFDQTTEAQFDEIVNVHFKGVYFLTQKLLPLMNDGGRIVNVSSGLARFALPGSSAYGAAKGAVEVLTRYLAKGTRTASYHRKRDSAWSYPNGLQWRNGAGQSRGQQACRRDDCAGASRSAG